MKLRRALAILALFAVAILPVAAAPAVVSGTGYTGFLTDGTNFMTYADMDILVKATVDDFNTFYLNIGRALLTYPATVGATATSGAENVNFQVMYNTTDIAKFFALEKIVTLKLDAGYYYTVTASYMSKTLGGLVNVGSISTTGYNWWMQATAALPGLGGVKFGVAPVALGNAATTLNAFNNDWIVVGYTNLALGGGMTVDADFCYSQNKNANLGQGLVMAEAAFNMDMGMLLINSGAGLQYNLAANHTMPLMYGATAKGTFYLDDKKTTFVGGAAGIRGTTLDALERVEVDAFVTPIPLIDLMTAVCFDLRAVTTTANGLAATLKNNMRLDACARLNLGVYDLYIGFMMPSTTATYTANIGTTWGGTTMVGSATNPSASQAYVKFVMPF